MLGNKNAYKKQVVNAMFIIMGIAMVLSLVSTVFAANGNDEVASFRTMDTAIIKGSENVPFIEPIEFLKADIESYELDMLFGAKNLIIKNRPKIAICIYHSPGDMFEIINYLHSLVPEYKFIIRHHSTCLQETVLYAFIAGETV